MQLLLLFWNSHVVSYDGIRDGQAAEDLKDNLTKAQDGNNLSLVSPVPFVSMLHSNALSRMFEYSLSQTQRALLPSLL